jgi:hypothetical protein
MNFYPNPEGSLDITSKIGFLCPNYGVIGRQNRKRDVILYLSTSTIFEK